MNECVATLRGEPVRQSNLRQATKEIAVQRVLKQVPIAESIRAGTLLWRTTLPVLRQIFADSAVDSSLMIDTIDSLYRSIQIRLDIGATAQEDTELVLLALAGEKDPSKPTALTGDFGAVGCGPLTAREREVLSGVSRGLGNRAIAKELGITEATVKRHMKNIFDKLGAVSRVDALNKANLTQIRSSEESRRYPRIHPRQDIHHGQGA